MAKILDKKLVSPAVYELVIEAPLIARKCKPGQFVIVLSDPESERVPFTIADFDREKGTITMIIQVVGNTSRHICEDFEAGDEWDNIVGPLGQPSEMKNFGTVVCVDGPEFDAHKVDFANLMERQKMYKTQESVEWGCGGACKCLK